MLSQLIFANFHFGLNIFGAFVFFMTGWLYFDAWKVAKNIKSDLVRSFGFFLLAVVTIVYASTLIIPGLNFWMQMVKIFALSLIVGSLAVELILYPSYKKAMVLLPFGLLADSLVPLSAVLFLLVALLYLRKSTEGKDKQIRPVALAFFFLAFAELINIASFASGTTIVLWSKLLAEYGLFWSASHLLELTGFVVLGLWTWGYLRFKVNFQLFITIISSCLLIFMVTTASFTFLLLRNLEIDTLAQLKTDVGVMQYALKRLEMEALADARAVAKDAAVQSAFMQNEDEKLFELTSELMLTQKTNFLMVASASGEVVARAEDYERIGDSLLENYLFKSAIAGQPSVTVEVEQGAVVPEIQIQAADSFVNNTGVIITGFSVDNAFVDGIKASTGLDTSVYSQDTRAATTFIAPDGKSRFVGSKETNEKILSTVIEKGEIYTGSTTILNQPFYTAYAPLRNAESENLGMLFVGKPKKELLETAQKSRQLTFAASAVLIVLSVFPAYYVSRHIKENIKA